MSLRRLINVREASEYLDLSVNTIYSLVSKRRIPFVKMRRLTKFDLEKIDDWIKENSVEEEKFEQMKSKKPIDFLRL